MAVDLQADHSTRRHLDALAEWVSLLVPDNVGLREPGWTFAGHVQALLRLATAAGTVRCWRELPSDILCAAGDDELLHTRFENVAPVVVGRFRSACAALYVLCQKAADRELFPFDDEGVVDQSHADAIDVVAGRWNVRWRNDSRSGYEFIVTALRD